jgi:hypothetical protein
LLNRICRVSVKSAIVAPAGVVKDSVWYVLLTALAPAPASRPMPPVQFVSADTPAMAVDGFQALLAQFLPAAAQLYTW